MLGLCHHQLRQPKSSSVAPFPLGGFVAKIECIGTYLDGADVAGILASRFTSVRTIYKCASCAKNTYFPRRFPPKLFARGLDALKCVFVDDKSACEICNSFILSLMAKVSRRSNKLCTHAFCCPDIKPIAPKRTTINRCRFTACEAYQHVSVCTVCLCGSSSLNCVIRKANVKPRRASLRALWVIGVIIKVRIFGLLIYALAIYAPRSSQHTHKHKAHCA